MRIIALCGALLLATGAAAQELPIPAQSQGHSDRQAFEAWVQALPADQHRGADFWAQERSKPKPQSCAARGLAEPAGFTTGCDEARGRLAGFDVRRKTEPDYRGGWNAPLDQQAGIQSAPIVAGKPDPGLNWHVLPEQLITPFSGAPVSLIKSMFPGQLDCSDRYCEISSDAVKQKACPRIATCLGIELIIVNGIVRGYVAEFIFAAWELSLGRTTKDLGAPAKKVIEPGGVVRMKNVFSSWEVMGNITITYTATSGYDAFDRPLNTHSIMVSPR